MPSTATITAFYSFTANTKARASQVNGNFDVFRGHLIPIDPNTQTAISNTYDLGSTEYYWRTTHTKAINKGTVSATTTAAASGFAVTPGAVGGGLTTTSTAIVGSTISIYSTGSPIELSFYPLLGTRSLLGVFYLTATGSVYTNVFVELFRNGSTICVWSFSDTNIVDRFAEYKMPASALKFFDYPTANTAATYELKGYLSSKTEVSFVQSLGKFYAKEIY